jgi:SAM-dependent methyltransferase
MDVPQPDEHDETLKGHASEPRICDYEDSNYRRDFWENADRDYEDAAERLALRDLLPPDGGRLMEIGAGFGRLAAEYEAYEETILLDYAQSMVEDAHSLHGDRYTYVCADLYQLPLASGSLDAVVQVRVLHHVEHIEAAFAEVSRVLRDGGVYVLEFANKRNLKSILRFAARRQSENPFDQTPYEFVELNWNFHPAHVERALSTSGLAIEARRSVSHFRIPAVKRLIPASTLARLDHAVGGPLAALALAPSQMVLARKHGESQTRSDALWRCPSCGTEPLKAEDHSVPCPSCGQVWPIVNGIHIFRDTGSGGM